MFRIYAWASGGYDAIETGDVLMKPGRFINEELWCSYLPKNKIFSTKVCAPPPPPLQTGKEKKMLVNFRKMQN